MGAPSAPRIQPGKLADVGWVNLALARGLGLVSGGGPPNVFTTMARHRGVFRKWLRFAGALMPGGLLAREDSELLILRAAHNCGCDYEFHHHERLGRAAGLTSEEIQRVRLGPEAAGWSPRRGMLLAAADELHFTRTISGSLWSRLAGALSEPQLIELCLLVGHYEMLAMMLNALQVAPDALPSGPPSRAMRGLQFLVERRRGAGTGA